MEKSFTTSGPVGPLITSLAYIVLNFISTFHCFYLPDAGSECPMLDLQDPINNGPFLSLQNTSQIVFTSCGSPAFVPVPWAST